MYIGHGAPLLDDPTWSGQLRVLAGELPRPEAILIVSAHWESAPLTLSAERAAAPRLLLPPALAQRYDRDDLTRPRHATDLALWIVATTVRTTEPVHQHAEAGASTTAPGCR